MACRWCKLHSANMSHTRVHDLDSCIFGKNWDNVLPAATVLLTHVHVEKCS